MISQHSLSTYVIRTLNSGTEIEAWNKYFCPQGLLSTGLGIKRSTLKKITQHPTQEGERRQPDIKRYIKHQLSASITYIQHLIHYHATYLLCIFIFIANKCLYTKIWFIQYQRRSAKNNNFMGMVLLERLLLLNKRQYYAWGQAVVYIHRYVGSYYYIFPLHRLFSASFVILE